MAKDLNVSLGLLTKKFESGLKSATRSLQRFSTKTGDIGRSLTTSLTVPLAGLGIAALKSAADFERLQNQLTSVVGNADLAREQISRLKVLAESPGLGFEQAVSAAARLQAVGLNAGQAEEAIKEFGNAVARSGGGAQEFDGAILALTQIASKGKISAEEINQLNERIFEIRPALKKAFGTANSEELQKLGIDAEEFISKVTAEFSKLERVQGGLSNAFENIGISIKTFLADIGGVIVETFPVQQSIERLGTFLNELADRFKRLSPESQKFIITVLGITAAVGPAFLALSTAANVLRVFVGITALSTLNLKGLALSLVSVKAKAINAAKAFGALGAASQLALTAGIGIAIGLIASAFKTFNNQVNRANAVNRAFANVSQRAAARVSEEKAQVGLLVNVLQDKNISDKERITALEKLQRINPKYFGNLKIEKGLVEGLTKASDDFNDAILRRARLTAAYQELINITGALDDIKTQVENAKPTLFETLGSGLKSVFGAFQNGAGIYNFAINQAKVFGKNVVANKEALERQRDAIIELIKTESKLSGTPIGAGSVDSGLSGVSDISNLDPFLIQSLRFKDFGKTVSLTAKQVKEKIAEIATTVQNGFKLLDSDPQFVFLEALRDKLKQSADQAQAFAIGPGAELTERFNIISQALSAAVENFGLNSTAAAVLKDEYGKLSKQLNDLNKALAITEFLSKTLAPAFDAFFDVILSGSKNAFGAFKQALKQIINELIKAIAQAAIFAAIFTIIAPGAAAAKGGFKAIFGGNLEKLLGFSLFADGGIVNKPTRGLVGEAGPEAIIPLDRIFNGNGGQELELRVEGTELVALLKNSESIYNRIF